jgi:hypothetical protein
VFVNQTREIIKKKPAYPPGNDLSPLFHNYRIPATILCDTAYLAYYIQLIERACGIGQTARGDCGVCLLSRGRVLMDHWIKRTLSENLEKRGP